jgi:hypothetical protein
VSYLLKPEITDAEIHITRPAQISNKFSSHFKKLETRIYREMQKILGTMVTWCPRFVQACIRHVSNAKTKLKRNKNAYIYKYMQRKFSRIFKI